MEAMGLMGFWFPSVAIRDVFDYLCPNCGFAGRVDKNEMNKRFV
jgi:hypothetical protein